MEWVEVRGETLEAAKEEALDQLGVAREDAEFEVVQEPESRWLGFRKTEARVRARVRPTQPRPKKEGRGNRRQRGQRSRGQGGRNESQRDGGGTATDSRGAGGGRGGRNDSRRGGRSQAGGGGRNDRQRGRASDKDGRGDSGQDGRERQGSEQKSTAGTDDPESVRRGRGGESDTGEKGSAVSDDFRRGELVPVEEQRTMVTEFLEGLVDSFGVDATVSTSVEEEIVIGSIDGDDLGLLIGPKGGTMYAIQELARSAIQRKADGRDTSRLLVDVAGYRERRRAALSEFALRQAEQVKAHGTELALEPMSSADRKAIHDAIMEIDGVKSVSEGDDPRWVVLLPDEG